MQFRKKRKRKKTIMKWKLKKENKLKYCHYHKMIKINNPIKLYLLNKKVIAIVVKAKLQIN